MELSYSLHLGNDKNKSIKARQEVKNTPSGTTSKNNNAIQNVKQLGKVNHHNLRLYDNKQELIKTIKGSNDITKDVKELYLDLFDEARLEYNNKQTRDDRKIDNNFNKISNDTKHDLACEIVIELGNMEYWDEKSLEYKYQMTQVFEQQLEDIQEIVPDFYIANATIHFDEHSPHMHIVGVPVKENCKTGLSRQVGKTSIFTKESLVVIQDKMRERCIDEFNITYGMDDVSIEVVIDACKAACIHDYIITLPDGYQTFIGENGVNLSGGQRQRLTIARAFLKSSSILLLDEPTSALDVKTEEAINRIIETRKNNQTVIIIAHRLSTIRNADDIIVLHKGKVAERGCHFELLGKEGLYSKLYNNECETGIE